MTFVAGAVFWAGYTLAWWGWEAVMDRVPPGAPNRFWWPSIRDLVSPGRQAYAVPPRLGAMPGTTPLDKQNAADVATWEAENAADVAAGKPPRNIIVKATNQP